MEKQMAGAAFMVVFLATTAGGLILCVIIGFLTPGNKGYLKKMRERLFKGVTPDQVRATYVQRLLAGKFTIAPSSTPLHITAEPGEGTKSGGLP